MLIQDPETFKTWLTAKLGPLCDADPAALAKYVYALVKKDKPIEDLRSSMLDQLQVFLQKETEPFVELLFQTLETQNFDMNPSAPEKPGSPAKVSDTDLRQENVISTSTVPSAEEPEKKTLSVVSEITKKESLAAIAASAQNSNSIGSVIYSNVVGGRRDSDTRCTNRKSQIDGEERRGRGRRRGSSVSPDRVRRSRSRSYERRPRSRSRERDRARAWRNKSPPPRRASQRRRSYSKSPARRYSRSRSPPSKKGRYRNWSPPLRSRTRSRSRSHSRSRSPHAAARDKKELGDPVHGDTDMRVPALAVPSVVVPPEIPFGLRRCRDFDEKGYCMRGDLCPFDHGTDPVVLEDLQGMYNGSGAGGGVGVGGALAPLPPTTNTEYNPDAPSMEPRVWGRGPFRPRPMGAGGLLNHLNHRPPFGGGPGGPGALHHQRELINVVGGGGGGPYRGGHPHPHHHRPMAPQGGSAVRGGPGNLMMGLRHRAPLPTHPHHNNSLHVKKIPVGINNITHLNNHFSKFGSITNIQVGFGGDPEAALVTFASPAEANIAYKSTEAVLNNRFIRVFWYIPNNNNNTNNGPTNHNNNNGPNSNNENKQDVATPPRPSVLERLGAPITKVLSNIQPSAVNRQEEKVILTNTSLTKTIYVPPMLKKPSPVQPPAPESQPDLPELIKKAAEEVILKKKEEEAVVALKKKQEEAKKESQAIRKRKQELLDKQLNQQKLLIQRIESGTVKPEQKTAIMNTIKSLQESIEKLQKDLSSDVKAKITKISKGAAVKTHLELVKKTKEETQRELLDAELDLHNRQQEGKNAEDLLKKVADLKSKALSLELSAATVRAPPVVFSARGRSSFRGLRGRGAGRGRFVFSSAAAFDPNAVHTVVDHRPTKLLVSGYEQDDKEQVILHFSKFGKILDYISDDATPSLVLNFKARKDAETALNQGRNFQDRLLSVTWATPNHNFRGGVPKKTNLPTRMVEIEEPLSTNEQLVDDPEYEDELIGMVSPEDSLLQDEEEDEDDERSWKR